MQNLKVYNYKIVNMVFQLLSVVTLCKTVELFFEILQVSYIEIKKKYNHQKSKEKKNKKA